MKNNYDDIINFPRWNPMTHPRMSIESRSAQFAPFAALTGYDGAVKETARLTDRKIEIDEGLKQVLNKKLQYILENSNKNPVVEITYFLPDDRKKGGMYVEKIGEENAKKSDINKISLENLFISFSFFRIDFRIIRKFWRFFLF